MVHSNDAVPRPQILARVLCVAFLLGGFAVGVTSGHVFGLAHDGLLFLALLLVCSGIPACLCIEYITEQRVTGYWAVFVTVFVLVRRYSWPLVTATGLDESGFALPRPNFLWDVVSIVICVGIAWLTANLFQHMQRVVVNAIKKSG